MALEFRLALPSDYERLEKLAIDSFGPITWMKKADPRFGPLNGKDWRVRWQLRFRKAFDSQIVLVGEEEGEIVAFASGTLDHDTLLGLVDLLGVDPGHHGRGYGRQMLRAFLAFLKAHGAVHANLECLTDNDVGNNLYRSEGFEEVARSIRWFKKLD